MSGNFIDSIALNRDLSGGISVKSMVPNRTNNKKLGPHLVISSGLSQGVIGKFSEITDQCRSIAESLKSKGALNLQCRVIDNQVYVFEINPRHSGTTSIRSMVGFNEPDLLIKRHILGQAIELDRSWPLRRIERRLIEEEVRE
jgi:carbamoyl-phosphate synthase large subunit